MRIPGRRAILVLAALASPGAARAAFVDLGAGARAPGMGNAFTAVADDAYSISYNPAGLATLVRPEVSATYAKILSGLSDGSSLGQSNLAFAQPLRNGRMGTLGIGYQSFSLDSLYNERTVSLAYGHALFRHPGGSSLFWGASLKNLTRSFQPTGEALNAMSNDPVNPVATGAADPLLAGNNSQSAWGADLGLLYRSGRRLTLGLALQNVNSPNIAFGSDPEKLSMSEHVGVAYKALWMNLTAEVQRDPAPDGSMDNDFILGGERFFPTLDYGEFGLRASIGTGSRSWKQFTAGASYKVNKVQFDYAFLMPLGGISGTMGTHRLGMTFHFGGHTPEEEYSEALVSQLQRVRERAGAGLGYEYSDVNRPAPLDRADLAEVKAKIDAGRFFEAHQLLLTLIDARPNDAALFHLARRLDTVVSVYTSFGPPKGKPDEVTMRSIMAFLAGADRNAVLLAGYAYSLNMNDREFKRYMGRLEDSTELKAPLTSKDRNLWQDKQAKAIEEFQDQNYVDAAQQCADAVVLEPGDVKSLERLGSNLFMLGQYEPASDAWRRAVALETDAKEKQMLESYIVKAGQAKANLEKGPAPMPAEKPRKEVKELGPRTLPTMEVDPRDLEKLYEVGIEYYARGETAQAAATFQRILDLDPENVPARKALERIQRGSR